MADALETRFQDAAEAVQDLPERPDNATLLRLYALYKQATAGDVEGKRPGMMDFSGRAKYDAWAEVEGTPREDAMEQYIALVERLRAG
jgi:diazepam-binding inhibitor (GABA receptor modulator, acyl-CoA-binding protein)